MKRLLIVLLTLLLVFIAILAVPVIHRQWQLSTAINQIAAAGDPVSMTDLRGNHAWDSSNAAWHLDRVQPQANVLFHQFPDMFFADSPWDWRDGLTDEQQQTIASAMVDHADVLAAIDKSLQCQRFFDIDETVNSFAGFQQQLFDRLNSIRTIQRILSGRCRYLAATGKTDEAAMVALDALRLARLQEQNPAMVSYMVAAACRMNALDQLASLVQDGKLSDATLAQLDEQLKRDDPMDGFVTALKTERAFGIELGRNMWLMSVISGGLGLPYLQYMDAQITLGTVSQFEETAIAIPQQPLAAMVAPMIQSSRGLMNRQRAKLRCLRVLIALQRHPELVIDPSSAVPGTASMSDLGLNASEVLDPFTGDPLMIRTVDERHAVFSAGDNERFDEGVTDAD